MADTIRELLVSLGVTADTDAVKQFDTALGTVRRTMLAVAGAAVTATGAIVANTIEVARAGDQAAKTAAQLGITAEEYQELTKAADLSGASQGQLSSGLGILAKNAFDASRGIGEAKDIFRDYGVSVTDVNGDLVSTATLLERAADVVGGLTNETEKVAVAQRLFGRSGKALIPLLNAGSQGVQEMRQSARDLGMVLSNEAARDAEEFTDRLADVRNIITGLRRRISVGLLPVFTRFLGGMRELFLANREVINQRVDAVAETIADGFMALERALKAVNAFIQNRVGGWVNLLKQVAKVAAFGGVVAGLTQTLRVLKALGVILATVGTVAGVSLSPIVVIVTAIVGTLGGLLAVGEDILVFLRGGESAVGRFLGAFGRSEEVRAQLLQLGQTLGAVFRELSLTFTEVFGPMLPTIEAITAALLKAATVVIETVLIGALNEFQRRLGLVNSAGQAFLLWLRGIRIQGRAVFSFLNAQVDEYIRRLNLLKDTVSGITGPVLDLASPVVDTARQAVAGATNSVSNVTVGGSTINLGVVESLDRVLGAIRQDDASARRKALGAVLGGPR